ncbi:MAG: hypothetical protein OHK93_007552 [Ramalina farinacea]|uniref:Uncharacterized protein n=1 Tax=Ramalina farinacea TaxID=258253 RepID=A0AA43QKP8_9LECA|nr:hypothetical protein [Ramalina farinacea]
MTPDKRKKALPTSQSSEGSDRPQTAQQWRLNLHRIKVSYLNGQWKKCSSRCQDLLQATHDQRSSLHTTYLCFYAALSVEASARTLHPISIAKLHALYEAKQFLEWSLNALPERQVMEEVVHPPNVSTSPTNHRSPSSIESISPSFDSVDSCNTYRPYSPPSSLESDDHMIDTSFGKPLPLRITKSVKISGKHFTLIRSSPQSSARSSLESTASAKPEVEDIAQRDAVMDYTGIWLRNRRIERFNEHLDDFISTVLKNLEMIEAQITATKEAQAARYIAGRVASRAEEDDAKGADLRERILRLKATGWRRERFDASKYEQLCELALAEL